MATPSFQSVFHPDHRMMKFATMNAIAEKTSPYGSRHGRSASGSRRRKTPKDNGAPAYIRTLALVIRPISDCQLGNGRKQTHPMMNAKSTPSHGTLLRLSRSNMTGA